MSDVTFTPEQVREIRRRIEDVKEIWCGDCKPVAHVRKTDALAAFPLPKVTRYRTFRHYTMDYRVCNGRVEYAVDGGGWAITTFGSGSPSDFAAEMTRLRQWTTLAAFADVCARPTEEVDA